MLLADGLSGIGGTEIVVVTAGALAVTGDEALVPAASALTVAARVVPQEHPGVRCRVVDLAPGDASTETPARVAAEVVGGAEYAAVAFRGRHRWVRGFHPVRPPAPAKGRDGAVVLVGPLDGRNGQLAASLAGPEMRIALVSPAAADPAFVRGMEEQGAEVAAFRADLSDTAAIGDALAGVESRFGSIDTLVFSPDTGALGGFAAIADWDAEWGAQLAAWEAQHDALAAALEGRRVRAVLVESSLAPVLGAVARVRLAAAHALTDGFAAAHGWTSVGWDAWHAGEADAPGIAPGEVADAFRAVQALAAEPQVLVSTVGLEARIRAASAPPAAPAAAEKEAGATLYERPELDVDYHPPTNDVEEKLAALWQELLGIQRVGIHDDFFGLGGHSLLATQIVARVRDLFLLDLPLQAIFEAPTIAKFAQLVEDAIIAELEALSEDEAASLMGSA